MVDYQRVQGSWSLPCVGVCFNRSWGRNPGAFKGPWEGLFRVFFRIVFSSIFEPWAHLETVSFHIVFLVFWANVVSSSECHLHSLHDCFFESLKTQILISLVFNSIFHSWFKIFVLLPEKKKFMGHPQSNTSDCAWTMNMDNRRSKPNLG